MNRLCPILCCVFLIYCPSSMATEYQGNVGQLAAVFSLDWKSDGSVSGTYYFTSAKGQVRKLLGSNFKEGELYLEEHTGQNITAKCHLRKKLTKGQVSWEGEMQTADGRFPIRFARQREANAPATTTAAPLSTKPKELSDEEFASRIKTEVVWSTFPFADRVVDRVPAHFDSARFMRAKVENTQSDPDNLTLAFRVGLSADGDWSNVRFSGPLVTFRIKRSIPIPRDEIVGKEISLQYDQQGKLLAISLLGVGVVHVRKPLNKKKLEVQVLVENDNLSPLFDENATPADRRRALERAPSFSLLPDKLALLNRESTELMFFRVLQLVNGYGAVIQTMDTGPGILELEGLDLEVPAEQNPWISVGEWSRWGPIPPTQRTTDFD